MADDDSVYTGNTDFPDCDGCKPPKTFCGEGNMEEHMGFGGCMSMYACESPDLFGSPSPELPASSFEPSLPDLFEEEEGYANLDFPDCEGCKYGCYEGNQLAHQGPGGCEELCHSDDAGADLELVVVARQKSAGFSHIQPAPASCSSPSKRRRIALPIAVAPRA